MKNLLLLLLFPILFTNCSKKEKIDPELLKSEWGFKILEGEAELLSKDGNLKKSGTITFYFKDKDMDTFEVTIKNTSNMDRAIVQFDRAYMWITIDPGRPIEQYTLNPSQSIQVEVY